MKDEGSYCIYCGSSDIESVEDELDGSMKIFTCHQCHTEYSELEQQQALQSQDGAKEIILKSLPGRTIRRGPHVDSTRLSKSGTVFFISLAAIAAAVFTYFCMHSDSLVRIMLSIEELIFEPRPEGASSYSERSLSLYGYLTALAIAIAAVSAERPCKAFFNKLLRKRLQ